MIKRENANGWIRGFKAPDKAVDVGWMFLICYMHDSLIFCDAEVEQLKHVSLILSIFEAVSGIHVH